MQRTEQRTGTGEAERKRVEAVVETLAAIDCQGESVAEVAHDARNMVTTLGLYCDLLEEPGVLATPFAHYGSELRLVAAASRRLVERLVALDASRGVDRSRKTNAGTNSDPGASAAGQGGSRFPDAAGKSQPSAAVKNLFERGREENGRHETPRKWDLMPATPIENLAAELLANHNLLAALAGPAITLTADVEGCARPVRLTGEDLTRVLVNLIKNAAEAMPGSGRIRIGLHELPAVAGTAEILLLTVEDNGPGIPEESLEKIFASGYTTRAKGTEARGSWPVIHRGLGLSITRSIVEAAGGRAAAANRAIGGARFEIELPVRKTR